MKKIFIIVLIIICILIGIVFFDSIQALLFNNDPIIGTEMWCKKKEGILVETYHCDNGKKITKFKKNNLCNLENICKEWVLLNYGLHFSKNYFKADGNNWCIKLYKLNLYIISNWLLKDFNIK